MDLDAQSDASVRARLHLDKKEAHLVDKQHAGHDLSLALFPPVADLRVDLVPQLRLDLSRVTYTTETKNQCSFPSMVGPRAGLTSKEGEEALCPRVDDVDLVQRDGVDDLFPDLELSLGTLDELCL